MTAAAVTFSQWLAQARIPEHTLTPERRGLLQAAYEFRRRQGTDYYSTRLLSHFLLNTSSGLKVAQVARLLNLSRPTASRQQRSSSKEAIQQAHHRMDGRPYGKLLPRYAGPIAGFRLTHPTATRHDTLDFIAATFGVRVSTVALYKFFKRYGLEAATRPAAGLPLTGAPAGPAAPPPAAPPALITPPPHLPAVPIGALPPLLPSVPQGQPVPMPAPPFWPHGPSTPAPSC